MTCDWLACYAERYAEAARHGLAKASCAYNEHLLVEWLVWHRLNVSSISDVSMGPSLWSRPAPDQPLQMLEQSVAPTERSKALQTHGIQLSDGHVWHAAAYDGGSMNLTLGCRALLVARGRRAEGDLG